jgi:hypothetical protein
MTKSHFTAAASAAPSATRFKAQPRRRPFATAPTANVPAVPHLWRGHFSEAAPYHGHLALQNSLTLPDAKDLSAAIAERP